MTKRDYAFECKWDVYVRVTDNRDSEKHRTRSTLSKQTRRYSNAHVLPRNTFTLINSEQV